MKSSSSFWCKSTVDVSSVCKASVYRSMIVRYTMTYERKSKNDHNLNMSFFIKSVELGTYGIIIILVFIHFGIDFINHFFYLTFHRCQFAFNRFKYSWITVGNIKRTKKIKMLSESLLQIADFKFTTQSRASPFSGAP